MPGVEVIIYFSKKSISIVTTRKKNSDFRKRKIVTKKEFSIKLDFLKKGFIQMRK